MAAFIVLLGVLLLGYLFLKANAGKIYQCLDRVQSHDTGVLPKNYEVPRYYTLKASGAVDPSRRWPGWDGWYFFVIPEDRQMPLKMVRASLMTGLYGLQGIDSYEKLPNGLSAFDVVEYLILAPMEETGAAAQGRENRFIQCYLPKVPSLIMQPQDLDIEVTGNSDAGGGGKLYGRIRGAWPDYQFKFSNLDIGIQLDLTYRGENLLWWADLPFFTYFAALGKFAGQLTYTRGAGTEETYVLEGRGSFEHGFARKPCNFDSFWLPIKWLQKLIPALRPIRYHYEVFLGDGPHQGGFMQVRAFGINWRNRGGVFLSGFYQELHNVEVEYLNDPEPDLMPMGAGVPPLKFYRSWKIRAETADGRLEYIGLREWPPAHIAGNMMYYNFSYAGTYQGERISGRGYGEYLHI